MGCAEASLLGLLSPESLYSGRRAAHSATTMSCAHSVTASRHSLGVPSSTLQGTLDALPDKAPPCLPACACPRLSPLTPCLASRANTLRDVHERRCSAPSSFVCVFVYFLGSCHVFLFFVFDCLRFLRRGRALALQGSAGCYVWASSAVQICPASLPDTASTRGCVYGCVCVCVYVGVLLLSPSHCFFFCCRFRASTPSLPCNCTQLDRNRHRTPQTKTHSCGDAKKKGWNMRTSRNKRQNVRHFVGRLTHLPAARHARLRHGCVGSLAAWSRAQHTQPHTHTHRASVFS